VEVPLPSSSCGFLGELFAKQVLLEEGRGARVVLAAQVAQEVVDHQELREVVSCDKNVSISSEEKSIRLPFWIELSSRAIFRLHAQQIPEFARGLNLTRHAKVY
jgi:hypothetical protein